LIKTKGARNLPVAAKLVGVIAFAVYLYFWLARG
jgi:hypothetical protein